MTNTELSLLSAAVGALFGALFGGVFRVMADRYSIFKETKVIAAAVRAEIGALLTILQERNYAGGLDAIIERLRQADYQPTYADIFAVEVAQDYFVVFNSNAAKLGVLGVQAVPIVRLYVLAKALVEDFTTNVRVQEHAMDRGLSINREVTLRIAESMRDLIERIRPEAVLAINALDAYSKKRWLRILP